MSQYDHTQPGARVAASSTRAAMSPLSVPYRSAMPVSMAEMPAANDGGPSAPDADSRCRCGSSPGSR